MQESTQNSKTINQTEYLSVSTAFVYVLSRPEHPNVSKVGFTNISAKSRANNYTDGEWVIYEEFSMPNFLARLTEKSAHQQLSEYWLDPKITGGTASEIFMCSPEIASIAVEIAKDESQKNIYKAMGLPINIFELINNYSQNDEIAELKKSNKNLKITISELQIKLEKIEFINNDKIKNFESKIIQLEISIKNLLAPILQELELSFEEIKNIAKTSQLNSTLKIKHKLIEAIELASKYRKILHKQQSSLNP